MFDVLIKIRAFLPLVLAALLAWPEPSAYAQWRGQCGASAPAGDKPPLAKSDAKKRILAAAGPAFRERHHHPSGAGDHFSEHALGRPRPSR